VVGPDDRTTTQAAIDEASADQFAQDRKDALEAEKDANRVRFTGDDPGSRTYSVMMGTSAADNHVAVDEMLPSNLDLVAGDKVTYRWDDPHNVHSVLFPAPAPGTPDPIQPFGFDCGTTFSPTPTCSETGESWENQGGIFDPGTSPSKTLLTNPTALVDSGVLVGTGYEVQPTSQRWSVKTRAGTTADGTYLFHCTIHDFMRGSLTVTG
jgi:plastocyanin